MRKEPLVHVVDDDESLRTAILRLLSGAGHKARGYASADEFLPQAELNRPGCVLLELNLPGGSGLELQDELGRRGVDLPVIFLTGRADVPSSVRALKAGALDFLTKPVDRSTLLAALDRALRVDAGRRAARLDSEQLLARYRRMTPREREVFERVIAGRLNKQIADDLGIAERTVKLQRARVMDKLGVRSAAELGRFAERFDALHGRADGPTVALVCTHGLAPAPGTAMGKP
jgi:FixJ family two-component response regulator